MNAVQKLRSRKRKGRADEETKKATTEKISNTEEDDVAKETNLPQDSAELPPKKSARWVVTFILCLFVNFYSVYT